MKYFNSLDEYEKNVTLKIFKSVEKFEEYFLKHNDKFSTPRKLLEVKKLRCTKNVINDLLNVNKNYSYRDLINGSKIILFSKYKIKFSDTEKLFENNLIKNYLEKESPNIDFDVYEVLEFHEMFVDLKSGNIISEIKNNVIEYKIGIFKEIEKYGGFVLHGILENGKKIDAYLTKQDYLNGNYFNIYNSMGGF